VSVEEAANMIRLNPRSAFWVFAQQAVTRLLVAIKFFLLARVLGPHSIGLIAACLMALSIAESLTEMGMGHALIQQREELDHHRLDALWTATVLRGAALTVTLLVASPWIAVLIGLPASTMPLRIVAFVPMARCTVSLGMVIAQRERRFRSVALLTSAFAMTDCLMSSVAALAYQNVVWVLAALPLSELMKSVASHVVFSTRPRLDFDTKPLAKVMRFGGWVWSSTLLTVIANQLDRVIAVKCFGVQVLGVYQTASRLAQLGVADFGIALSQYLFPNFSELARRDKHEAARRALILCGDLGTIVLVLATFFAVVGPDFIQFALGEQWSATVPFFRAAVFLMAAGVLVGVLTACLRGIGKPSRVTYATLIQLAVLVTASLLLVPSLGPIGVGLAAAMGVCAAMSSMLRDVLADAKGQSRHVRPLLTIGAPLALLIAVLGQLLSAVPYHALWLGIISLLFVAVPLQRLRVGVSLTT
jgi:PST family polysaccharide transporter